MNRSAHRGCRWSTPSTRIGGDRRVLFDRMFPDWFAGVAFAAIAIGALVPAAIMSIAAANLFTRNVYKEYLRHRPHTPPLPAI